MSYISRWTSTNHDGEGSTPLCDNLMAMLFVRCGSKCGLPIEQTVDSATIDMRSVIMSGYIRIKHTLAMPIGDADSAMAEESDG